MRTRALERRHHASAKVAQAWLIISKSMLEGYAFKPNAGSAWPEWLVCCAIRLNDHRRKPPISKNKIHKKTGIPRKNVDGYVANMLRHHVIKEKDGGYIGDDGFLQRRIDARYFKRITRAAIALGNVLKKLGYK